MKNKLSSTIELKTYGESAGSEFSEMDELAAEQARMVFNKVCKNVRESKINVAHDVLSKDKGKTHGK